MAWPTTNDPRTEFVTIRLTANEAAELDQYAQSHGVSRSIAVRAAVADALAKTARAQKRTTQTSKKASKP